MSTVKEDIYKRGIELFQEGKYIEAEPYLRAVIRENPQYADILNKLGIISSIKGDIKQAIHYFEEALRINPRYTEARMNLAVSYNEIGEFKKAQEVFREAGEISKPSVKIPDPFVAGKIADEHFRIGNLYFDLELYEDAIDEYEKSISLRPDFPDVRTKLGVALRNTGQVDEAIKEFNTAKKLNSNYIPAWIQLGITYYLKGLKELAIKEWKGALEIDPQCKEARAYLQILKEETD